MSQIESVVYESPLVAVGTFRCPREHVRFAGGAVDAQLVAFPRTSVVIERTWHPPLVADPTVAVLYDRGDEYRRSPVDRMGDHTDWFSVCDDVAHDITERCGSPHEATTRLFKRPTGSVSAALYLLQRRIITSVAAAAPPHEIDEAVIDLVGRVIESKSDASHQSQPATRLRHRELVDATKRFVLSDPCADLSLDLIAGHVHVSTYHLVRTFRALTSLTIHQYITQVRLRRALDRALDPHTDLSTLAVESGFSSHSHFTYVFRRSFGVAPSQLRRLPPARLNELRKIVTV